MLSFQSIFENALKLRPQERAQLIEGLLNSLEKPDEEIDNAWEEEAKKVRGLQGEARLRQGLGRSDEAIFVIVMHLKIIDPAELELHIRGIFSKD